MDYRTELLDFCIKIDFEKGSENPQRIFESMIHLLASVDEFHSSFSSSISSDVKPKIIIQDIRGGSIETWLSTDISREDEKGRKFQYFLNRCTEIIVKFIDGRSSVDNLESLGEVQNEMETLAEELDIVDFPNVYSLNRARLLKGLVEISKAGATLSEKDDLFLLSSGEKLSINKNFYLSDDAAKDLMVSRVSHHYSKEPLFIKKADFLGRSMWDFIRNKTTISVKIRDENWLNRFHSKEERIGPGDGLLCDLKITIFYDRMDKQIDVRYEIEKVHSLLGMDFNQLTLNNCSN